MFVDCSTIALDESAAIRARLKELGSDFLACPVSGNAKVIKAGKLSAVASGPEALFRQVEPLIEVFAPNGVSYVGEGELARVCKIAHNVMLGVVIENLIEIMLVAEKAGVPRHAFLAFINNGVMGSMFTRYKSPALVNLDWTTTFTPELLRKDMDLGLALGTDVGVPMPVTAAAREVLQSHFGAAQLKPDPEKYLAMDFAALLETMAIGAGVKLKSENKHGADGAGVAVHSARPASQSGRPSSWPSTAMPAFAGMSGSGYTARSQLHLAELLAEREALEVVDHHALRALQRRVVGGLKAQRQADPATPRAGTPASRRTGSCRAPA